MRKRHYTPQLSPLVVSALYHEARKCRVPMTVLVDQIIRIGLKGTEGWRLAESARVAEEAPTPKPQG
jgi:hypothetical protein